MLLPLPLLLLPTIMGKKKLEIRDDDEENAFSSPRFEHAYEKEGDYVKKLLPSVEHTHSTPQIHMASVLESQCVYKYFAELREEWKK
jgi:hypothetical protein